MYEAKGFQLLSGIMVEEKVIFWPIFLNIIFFISGTSFVAIVFKIIQERWKEFKIKQKIQINLKKKPSRSNLLKFNNIKHNLKKKPSRSNLLQFNNIKHNLAILSGPQIAAICLLILGLFTIFRFVEQTNFDDEMIPYQIFLYRLLLIEPILIRLIVPIWHLSVSKELRVFIGMRIKDMT